MFTVKNIALYAIMRRPQVSMATKTLLSSTFSPTCRRCSLVIPIATFVNFGVSISAAALLWDRISLNIAPILPCFIHGLQSRFHWPIAALLSQIATIMSSATSCLRHSSKNRMYQCIYIFRQTCIRHALLQ